MLEAFSGVTQTIQPEGGKVATLSGVLLEDRMDCKTSGRVCEFIRQTWQGQEA